MKKILFVLLALTATASAGFITNAGIGGFGTTTIFGSAHVDFNPDSSPPPPSASVHAEANAFTAGPVRPGFFQITANGGGEFGVASVRVGSNTFNCSFTCMPPLNGPLIPFTLGVAFQIQADAFATTLNNIIGSADIDFQFSLLDRQGLFQVISQAPDIPEPTTWVLMGLGLVGLVARRKFLKTSSSLH